MKRSEKLIENKFKKPNGELWGEDKLDDNNHIEFKLDVMFFIKLVRMSYIVSSLVLFIAVVWLILVKQTYSDVVYPLFKEIIYT
jgi:hypothetical protein